MISEATLEDMEEITVTLEDKTVEMLLTKSMILMTQSMLKQEEDQDHAHMKVWVVAMMMAWV